jgi:hypothetical protein
MNTPLREESSKSANPLAWRYIIAWALALVFYFLEYAARSSPGFTRQCTSTNGSRASRSGDPLLQNPPE